MRFIILLLLTSLTLCLNHTAIAHDGVNHDEREKPYKATTVDECIQEAQCVLYHLLLAVQSDVVRERPSKDIAIKKWTRPLNIAVLGRDNPNKILNRHGIPLSGASIPYSVDAKKNFIIQFTNNIESQITNEKYNPIFLRDGNNIALQNYKNIDTEFSQKCFKFHIQHPSEGIIGFFAFIQNDHPNVEVCFKEVMYAGHGLTNQMSSPIWDEYKQKNKYSKLEIFLMHLLYGSNIENGDSFETLKEKFPKAYAKTLHTYKRTGGLFYEQLYDD